MNREKLKRYRADKRELAVISKNLKRLYKQKENLQVVKGKVTASGKDFPYIEEHISVLMYDPKEKDRIEGMIQKREERQYFLQKEVKEIEKYIEAIPDNLVREVATMHYLEGYTQEAIGEQIGYTQSRISKLLKHS